VTGKDNSSNESTAD